MVRVPALMGVPQSLDAKPNKEVFISYGWGEEREELVDKLEQALKDKKIPIVRDKNEVGYKERIKNFMKRIGRGRCVIVVISKKYIESESCMFELVEIASNGDFYDRIFPIVLEDAEIYKPVERLKYVKHWEEQIGN
jgi:hypothetical protein